MATLAKQIGVAIAGVDRCERRQHGDLETRAAGNADAVKRDDQRIGHARQPQDIGDISFRAQRPAEGRRPNAVARQLVHVHQQLLLFLLNRFDRLKPRFAVGLDIAAAGAVAGAVGDRVIEPIFGRDIECWRRASPAPAA